MIDPLREELISFADACKILPRRRAGKKPALATLYRWSNTGHAGIRLEFVQVGNARCTSREAVARFINRVTEKSAPERLRIPNTRTPRQREREIRAAEAELARDGI